MFNEMEQLLVEREAHLHLWRFTRSEIQLLKSEAAKKMYEAKKASSFAMEKAAEKAYQGLSSYQNELMFRIKNRTT